MDRDEAIDAVVRSLRRVNLEGSLFGQRVAIRFGLSESDIEALEALLDLGASTAGRLGDLMGLTSGAVTRLIDRLEQSGYVRRVPDPADRRRVIIELVPDKVAAVKRMLDTIRTSESAELSRFSDDELRTINDFLARMAEVARTEAERLQTAVDTELEARAHLEHSAPIAGLTSARLVFRSGASEVSLRGAAGLDQLYRARFEGAAPRVNVRDGTVSIQYRGLPFDWRKRSADVALNATLPWSVEVKGGANKLSGSFDGLDLRSFDLIGGASDVSLALGRPTSEVPIRIVGGMDRTRISRPAGVGVRLQVRGGMARIDLDGRRIAAIAGPLDEALGDTKTSDRYLVQITGGASRLELSERPA
jgi:DNA-binding MarR family transcriptional regulator